MKDPSNRNPYILKLKMHVRVNPLSNRKFGSSEDASSLCPMVAYPLVKQQFAIESGQVEIVSCPMNGLIGGYSHRFLNVWQRHGSHGVPHGMTSHPLDLMNLPELSQELVDRVPYIVLCLAIISDSEIVWLLVKKKSSRKSSNSGPSSSLLFQFETVPPNTV